MGQTRFASGRQLDLICLGRLGVDLYAQQVGARLEDVSSFAKYLGGSSANIAFGTARLGLKSAMLSRVGDDHMGRFLVESLAREGCDVSGIKVDPERLTALVLLGLKDRETFPLVFYRENCADMALRAEDISETFDHRHAFLHRRRVQSQPPGLGLRGQAQRQARAGYRLSPRIVGPGGQG